MNHSAQIFLLRHGETTWNNDGRLQGHRDSPLTSRGRRQASTNGKRLRELLQDRSISRLVSSPLGRCRDTAGIVADALWVDRNDIEFDDRLKEHAYGDWEGRRMSEIKVSDAKRFEARFADRWAVPAPGGENYSMVATRLRLWLSDVVEEETLVVVSHGCAGRILRGIYTGMPREHIHELDEAHDDIYLLTDQTASKLC